MGTIKVSWFTWKCGDGTVNDVELGGSAVKTARPLDRGEAIDVVLDEIGWTKKKFFAHVSIGMEKLGLEKHYFERKKRNWGQCR